MNDNYINMDSKDIYKLIFEFFGSPDFDSLLDEFLSKIEYSRNSVIELLKVLESFDSLPIYEKLFTDFVQLLTEEELRKLKSDYKERFDLPLTDSVLVDELDKMPLSRKSVIELLKVLESFDSLPIYEKLLTDFVQLLTEEELEKLKSDYKERFDLPLPNEED